MSRGKVWTTAMSIIVVAIIAAAFVIPIPEQYPGAKVLNALPFKLGLDLQGGAHLVYQADVSEIPGSDRDAAVEGVRDVVERRVNALGVSEPLVQTNKTALGDYRVIVELAGVFDINEAKSQIGETPLLEFKEIDESPAVDTTALAESVAQEEEIRNQADSILQRALAGEDFAELAKEFSEDTSAANGGDLGFVGKGVFVPEFEDVLFNESLADGAVWPELVRSQFGYHIIQKVAERGEGEDREVQSRHILFKVPNAQALAGPQWKNTELTGKQLQRAELVFDPNTNAPQVRLQFDSEGDELFREITARNIGRPVAIFLDGTPISTPVVQQEISGGTAVVTGQFSIQEAKLLAQRLNAGALPVPIELVSQQTIGPSLGAEAVAASMKAAIAGLILVALFMLLYYRIPGLMSVLALVVYAVLLLGVFQLLGVTLTLAGIAGFILSLGLAVDANVLIFERMKEELRAGKHIREAVEDGFVRAWSSIRDSNISSLLTALILYWFGSSLIKGFAVTLGIGILLSMFSAIVVTRSFLRLFPDSDKLRGLFGVSGTRKN